MKDNVYFSTLVICANKILISQQLDLIVFLIAAASSLEIPALEVINRNTHWDAMLTKWYVKHL